MMHRCSISSHGNIVGPCTCGLFHSQTNSNCFSMLFSVPNHKPYDNESDTMMMYSYATSSSSSSSSSSVDCTLSLGTPSTRKSTDHEKKPTSSRDRRSSSNSMSNFCWDILQSKHSSPPTPPSTHKTGRASGGASANADLLLARRCANCDTTSTPLWRNGPRGPKSLCNACGIRFKKEERKATNAAAAAGGGGAAPGMMEFQQHYSSWGHQHHLSQAQKLPCHSPAYGNEFRFIDDDDRDPETGGIPCLSWRLNVTERPTSFVHDFTR